MSDEHARVGRYSQLSALVSVIVPTFDRRDMLRGAVASALAQRHPEVEVIVVDDGSTDGTRDLMTRSFGDDPRVTYHYQANAGPAAARNRGLDLARGDFVAFLDSDDAWKPWHLSLAVAALERHPEAGMVWTDTEYVDADGVVTSPSALRDLLPAYRYFSVDDLFPSSSPLADLGVDLPAMSLDRRLYLGDIFSAMIMGNLVLTSTAVMRRDRLERVGRFDERFGVGEDYEFFQRACRVGPVAFADIADGGYRIGTRDKLIGPAHTLEMARAYVRVLDGTLARDSDRITLPAPMIDEARVFAHRWVGEQELQAGRSSEAREHLATALRIRRRQPRVLALLVVSFLPRPVVRELIRWRRQAIARRPPQPSMNRS